MDSLQQAYKTIRSHSKSLQEFLPRTLDERLEKLRERINAKWPTFSRSGLYGHINELYLSDYDGGTVVRFFADDGKSFHHVGAVKHGAHWHPSEPIDGLARLTSRQMQDWLSANQLNWVITL
jgi:hypothetical protein